MQNKRLVAVMLNMRINKMSKFKIEVGQVLRLTQNSHIFRMVSAIVDYDEPHYDLSFFDGESQSAEWVHEHYDLYRHADGTLAGDSTTILTSPETAIEIDAQVDKLKDEVVKANAEIERLTEELVEALSAVYLADKETERRGNCMERLYAKAKMTIPDFLEEHSWFDEDGCVK